MNMLFQLTPWPINIYPQTLILYLFTRIAYMYNHQHNYACVLLTYIDSNLQSSQTEGIGIQTCCDCREVSDLFTATLS